MSENQHFDAKKACLENMITFFKEENANLLEKVQTWLQQPENSKSEIQSFIEDTTKEAIQKIKDIEEYLFERLQVLDTERRQKKEDALENLPSKKAKS